MSGVLVHEWLAPRGGSENVFEALSRVFPDAARYCLWNESEGRFVVDGETWLARTPLRGRKAAAVGLMPLAWRTLPSVDADWILTSSHLFAHHARFGGSGRGAPKLVYTHTPARYIWNPELDVRGDTFAARTAANMLKGLDRRRAQEPVAIAANSVFVQKRIAQAWHRESTVIHPPVDVTAFLRAPEPDERDEAALALLPETFLLGFSRFIPYKRLDLVIEAGIAADVPVVLGVRDRTRLVCARSPRSAHPVGSSSCGRRERSSTGRCCSAASPSSSPRWRTSASSPSRPWQRADL